ncbi:MAG: hypothetical protein MJA82_01965 [Clostridia bacterium]|nr:hypothetical protein [Clostridia bacterium]
MIDLQAAIIPWEEMGRIKLYSDLKQLYKILEQQKAKPYLVGKYFIRYEIQNKIDLWFNVINGKLFKITALKNYKGKLFDSICIGMHIDEVLKIDSSFIYDDFEEVYISSKGIYIETDPVNDTVMWISIYVKEIDNEDFEIGNW